VRVDFSSAVSQSAEKKERVEGRFAVLLRARGSERRSGRVTNRAPHRRPRSRRKSAKEKRKERTHTFLPFQPCTDALPLPRRFLDGVVDPPADSAPPDATPSYAGVGECRCEAEGYEDSDGEEGLFDEEIRG
jgi:hypothetical protein